MSETKDYYDQLRQGRNIPYKFRLSSSDLLYVSVSKEIINYIFADLFAKALIPVTDSNKLVIHDDCLRHTSLELFYEYD